MSHENAKLKHSQRIHQKKNYMYKQTKIAKMHGFKVSEPHRYAKHSAMNCGSPKCMMCGNPRKMWKKLTIQERRFYQEIDEYDSEEITE